MIVTGKLTLFEIRAIARERREDILEELDSYRLKMLLSELNRLRYSREEEADFILFYLAVHGALMERRSYQHAH